MTRTVLDKLIRSHDLTREEAPGATGAAMAAEAIDSGRARDKLESLRRFSNEMANGKWQKETK